MTALDPEDIRVSYNASKPGRRFEPDGRGGGTLHLTERIERRGFRSRIVTKTIRKAPLGAKE